MFRRIKENIGLPGDSGRISVRTMCHTRWTIKVDALGGIISNCIVLATEMKIGIHGKMNTVRYLYGIMLGEILLKHAHNLS